MTQKIPSHAILISLPQACDQRKVLGNKKSNLIAVRRSIGAQIFGNMLGKCGAEAFGGRCAAQAQTLAHYACSSAVGPGGVRGLKPFKLETGENQLLVV